MDVPANLQVKAGNCRKYGNVEKRTTLPRRYPVAANLDLTTRLPQTRKLMLLVLQDVDDGPNVFQTIKRCIWVSLDQPQ